MLKHFAFSIGLVYLVFLISWIKYRAYWRPERIAVLPWVLLISGLWSIVPSIINKLGIGLLSKIFNSFFISNLFFGYWFIRRVHSTGAVLGLAILLFVFLSLIYIFAYHLKLQEEEIKKLSK